MSTPPDCSHRSVGGPLWIAHVRLPSSDVSNRSMTDDSDVGPDRTCPPVLLVIFNRPAVVAQLIDELRRARPHRLFVAADGPRAGQPADEGACAAARAMIERIDWPCEITRRFRDHNLGLQRSMVDAIDWFFTYSDAGVILEDDCLVRPDFFPFAAEILDRYRHDDRVMAISALNMAPAHDFDPHSYFFASAGHIWGWATWRRAWEGYDADLSSWPDAREAYLDGATGLQRALARKFDAAVDGRKHTWARAWHHHVAVHRGLVVIPRVNLVRNVGFGPDATHTIATRHALDGLRPGQLPAPFVHPVEVGPNAAYDEHLRRFHTWAARRRLRESVRAIRRSMVQRSGSSKRRSPHRG